ncbi:sensor histidine kinase [Streptomyces sp. NPDC051018]|uniref:sensor histidine kinase n=1 Tax=Streptomyces sp. NPDC051018 TaxID=3365639 RepID=UPI00378E47F8
MWKPIHPPARRTVRSLMRSPVRPLLRRGTWRSCGYALLGAALALPPLAVAVILAGGVARTWPEGPRVLFVLAVTVALILAAGLPRPVRTRCVRLANSFLGTALPAPVPPAPSPSTPSSPGPATPVPPPAVPVPGGGGRERWRTSVWLLLHITLGWLVTAVSGLLALMAMTTAAVWLGGGDRVQFLTLTIDVRGGLPGAWTVPAALAALLAATAVAAGSAALFRHLAPVLLGPGRAERVAALEERMRALAESNRLAQELHDSIGHTLTASTIQAAVASELMESDPEGARRALSSIEETSRSALDDLDQVLGVLRRGEGAPPAGRHTLADLPGLLDRVRRAGTEVRTDITGEPARVPAAVSREAYRIVQEGLTNALRHAGGPEVTLRLAVTADWLETELSNPLPAARGHERPERPADTGRTGRGAETGRAIRTGYGLAGAEERVRLLHGEFSSGPTPDGRWTLAARIPLRSAR